MTVSYCYRVIGKAIFFFGLLMINEKKTQYARVFEALNKFKN